MPEIMPSIHLTLNRSYSGGFTKNNHKVFVTYLKKNFTILFFNFQYRKVWLEPQFVSEQIELKHMCMFMFYFAHCICTKCAKYMQYMENICKIYNVQYRPQC